MKVAQEQYKKKISELTELVQRNLLKCKEMDKTLGSSAEVRKLSREDREDHKGKEQCPIHLCTTKTVKLKRHLSSHELSDDQVKYALLCSKLFSRNCKRTEDTETIKRLSNTNLVNRKQNYKLCKLCNKLYMNMSDHLKTSHNMTLNSPNYENLVKTCKVVPKCYTKKVGGRATALTDKSLVEAMTENEAKIKNQQHILESLSALRKEMKETSERVQQNPTKEDEVRLKSLEHAYFEERHKDSTVYPNKIEEWRMAFLEHLTIRGDSNPKRGVTMATEVLCPSEPVQELTINDLLDVRKVREILASFKAKENTNSTSKLKYIKYFQSFVNFITTDFSSPEYSEASTNDELIARDIKLKTIIRN